MSSVVIALTTTRRDRLLAHLAASGSGAVLVTGVRTPWEPLPSGIQVVELALLEQRMWWYRIAFWWMNRLGPHRFALRERLLRRLATVVRGDRRTRLAAAARQARWTANARREGRETPADRMSGPLTRQLRPWLFWRAVRRHALASLPQITEIVYGDLGSQPLAWQLHRRSGAVVRPFHDLP